MILQLAGGMGVDWRQLHLEIRNMRLKIYLEVGPNGADAIDITVTDIKMAVKAMIVHCIQKGEIKEREKAQSQNLSARNKIEQPKHQEDHLESSVRKNALKVRFSKQR